MCLYSVDFLSYYSGRKAASDHQTKAVAAAFHIPPALALLSFQPKIFVIKRKVRNLVGRMPPVRQLSISFVRRFSMMGGS